MTSSEDTLSLRFKKLVVTLFALAFPLLPARQSRPDPRTDALFGDLLRQARPA